MGVLNATLFCCLFDTQMKVAFYCRCDASFLLITFIISIYD